MSSSTHPRLCGLTLAVVAAGLGSCSREPEEQPSSTAKITEIALTRHLDTGVRPVWDAVQAVLKERGYALAVRKGLMLNDEGRLVGSVRFDEKTPYSTAKSNVKGNITGVMHIPGRVIATHPDGTRLDVELKPKDAGKPPLRGPGGTTVGAP